MLIIINLLRHKKNILKKWIIASIGFRGFIGNRGFKILFSYRYCQNNWLILVLVVNVVNFPKTSSPYEEEYWNIKAPNLTVRIPKIYSHDLPFFLVNGRKLLPDQVFFIFSKNCYCHELHVFYCLVHTYLETLN